MCGDNSAMSTQRERERLGNWLDYMYASTYLICIVNRETAVKFNDYFEFPRELDMSPYTAAKLAKLEGTLYTHTLYVCSCKFKCTCVLQTFIPFSGK